MTNEAKNCPPPDLNLDVGKPTTAGMYKISDEAYARLVHKLAEHDFEGMPRPLREQIVAFYDNGNPPASAKLRTELQALKAK